MIIPAAHRIELATGGLGFAVRDARRPDIGPVRPGYLYVPGSSVLVPQPPIFDSVVAADGYLTVDVHSPSAVDGYEIGVSTTILPPATWWSTTSGHLVQPLATGTYYLFARASYQGAYSTWTQYGKLAPGDDEWRLSWADEAMDGADGAAYDYATVAYGHTSGFRFLKPSGYTPWIHQYCSYVNAFGLSLLPAVGGPKGTRIDTRLVTGGATAKLTGVAFGFDRTAMQSAPTSTAYYGLALRTAGGDENYAKYLGLYHVLDQTATLIAEADVTSLMTSRPYANGGTLYWVDVSVQARQNSFQVIAKGQLVLSATDNTIPWMDTKVGTGLWYQGSSNIGYSLTYYMNTGLEDYLRVYARDHTGEAETIDPGSADHNDLDGRSAADCHPASAVTVTPTGAIAATDVQAALAELDSEKAAASHTHTEDAILVSATDVLVGRATAGAGACEEISCTAAGRALLDDADAAAQRTTLGIATGTVWTSDNDGPGSTLDSDSVDGIHGAAIAQKFTAATITVGPSGRDFTTLQAAWDSLKGKTLTGWVNIDVDAGTYDPVKLNANPYGRYVNFRGDMRGGSGEAYAVSGNIAKDGDNCTVTLATWPTSTWGAGDYVTIGDCTTAANVGRFPVVSVDAVNYTVTYTNAAGVAEAAKTGTRLVFCPNRIVSRATDGQDFAVGAHVGQIIGFTCLGTVNSQGIYFNGAYNVNLIRVHAYGMGMGTGGYGGGNAGLNYFSAVKCAYGYYATSGMGAICYYANFHNCTMGVDVSGRSDFTNSAWVVTATGCGTAFVSKGFSPITLQSSHVASDNTTNYIPATANTVSTNGGLIIR